MAMTALVAFVGVILVATASLGVGMAARAQAVSAADSAALAAAVATYPAVGRGDPHKEAREVAVDNRARLVSCECPVNERLMPRVVTVVVAVPVDLPIFGRLDVHGSSRAEFDPRRWLGR